MATNHTENYALNLWEPTDAFVREEFNENTSKIDALLLGKPELIRQITPASFTNPLTVDLSDIDWDEWDMVAVMFYNMFDYYYDDQSHLYIHTSTGDSPQLASGKPSGRFVLFLPHHNGDNNIHTIVSPPAVPFLMNEPFHNIQCVKVSTGRNSIKTVNSLITVYGLR